MLDHIQLENGLVVDIETVPGVPDLGMLNEEMQELWHLKQGRRNENGHTPEEYFFDRAGILAEFGRVVCISVGFFKKSAENGNYQFRTKSFSGTDECELLTQFANLLEKHFHDPETHYLAGHNVKEFDIPYLCRRMLVNGCVLPALLNIHGRKPWEVNFVDTMQLWKFGDYKNYTSLRLLAAIFGIPTPKDDITGSDVGKVYWNDGDITRIAQYCQKDVLTVAQLLLRFKGLPLLEEADVEMV